MKTSSPGADFLADLLVRHLSLLYCTLEKIALGFAF